MIKSLPLTSPSWGAVDLASWHGDQISRQAFPKSQPTKAALIASPGETDPDNPFRFKA
jgi:hypothetical protein